MKCKWMSWKEKACKPSSGDKKASEQVERLHEDSIEFKGEAGAKSAGKLRTEGWITW